MFSKIKSIFYTLFLYKFPVVTVSFSLAVIFNFFLQYDLGVNYSIQNFNILNFFTYAFCHVSYLHLIPNLLTFLVLGSEIERKISSFGMFVFSVITLFITGIFGMLQYYPSLIEVVGMSGLNFGLLALLLTMHSKVETPLFVFYLFPIKKILLLSLTIIGMIFFIFFGDSNIAVSAHIGGVFSGMLMAHILNND